MKKSTLSVSMLNEISKQSLLIFNRCQTHIMDLLQELGIETFGQYLNGKKFMQIGSNKVSSYNSVIPSLSPMGLVDTHRLMTKVLYPYHVYPIQGFR